QWKRLYGGAIQEQMRRLGASVDWSREYFTMDENLSRAVREAFVRLYGEGLIYRGEYIVNWCPRCETAISDLEVKREELPGKLWEIRYPVIGMDEFITVATTRPETMLGDVAVAVNERDERYRHLRGRKALLPLLNRELPIITDELAQPEFGTGAVKVTPAHDANDFEAGLRHNLPRIEVIDQHASMNQNAGPYAGLDRYAARKRVLEDLQRQGFLAGAKDYVLALGRCQRCGTVVEPRLSTQWFVKIQPLANRAIEVVERDYVRFTPPNYRLIYLNWMRDIHDWCISRQLWWGHRIPAWHCECGEITVAREAAKECPKCGGSKLEQDPDVLDTWFSSGLLPFTSLGWPDATCDLRAFYPGSLLITGFDILFFWVARMIMLGCWFMAPPHRPGSTGSVDGKALEDSIPFREVYIHALVRDAERQKMSKTKGNVLDPIAVIRKYGTDATRFTLAAMSSPGTDIAFSEKRTDGYRAFANKIWNAARFMFLNIDRLEPDSRATLLEQPSRGAAGIPGFRAATLEDRWILSRFNGIARQVNQSLAAYRFDEAANFIYDFFWGELCDWYIELIKPRLAPDPKDDARTACGNLAALFEASLRLLHPLMPFITDELWQAMHGGSPPQKSVALAAYPQMDEHQIDTAAETQMAILQDLIVTVRNLRAELKVDPKRRVPIEIFAHMPETRTLIEANCVALTLLGNVEEPRFANASLGKVSATRHTARFDVRLIYESQIDRSAERQKLHKELEKLSSELANGERQLGNEQFIEKAPADVIA
ncbi:MAG: valine--tRNA ligase, partial [Acidobacteria bacterium]|nr:valine--tRNA ligase [Acidobacteriota bacterium]